MKSTTTAVPTQAAPRPVRIESFPRDGPTVRSSATVIGAGRAPTCSTIARSPASSALKLPVMRASPPGIRSRIDGADMTLSSRTMASCLPTLSTVTRRKRLAPLLVMVMRDAGRVRLVGVEPDPHDGGLDLGAGDGGARFRT